jgi:hypothetical protein
MNVQLNKPSYIAINSLHNTGCGTSNLLVSICANQKKQGEIEDGKAIEPDKGSIQGRQGNVPTTVFQPLCASKSNVHDCNMPI